MQAQTAAFSRRLAWLAPLVASVLGGCAHVAITSLGRDAADLPDRAEVVAGQLVIHADFPIAGQHRLVRDLETLRSDVSQTLGLPVSDEPVHLYLFQDTARYDAFAAKQFPNFPARRAFFVETDTTLSVFAPWQDRIAEDLRHETTHGYVHAVVPTVPLWLDEGIAEYFALPRGEQGAHRDHIAHLEPHYGEVARIQTEPTPQNQSESTMQLARFFRH